MKHAIGNILLLLRVAPTPQLLWFGVGYPEPTCPSMAVEAMLP